MPRQQGDTGCVPRVEAWEATRSSKGSADTGNSGADRSSAGPTEAFPRGRRPESGDAHCCGREGTYSPERSDLCSMQCDLVHGWRVPGYPSIQEGL